MSPDSSQTRSSRRSGIGSNDRRHVNLRPLECAGWIAALLAVSIGTSVSVAHAQTGYSDTAPSAKQTPAEATSYMAYTSPDTALTWLTELAALAGPVMRVAPFVTLPDGATGPPAVIPMATIGLGAASPGIAAASRGIEGDGARVRVLVIGSQHGDERTGYEVALRLARDLSVGDLRPLLDEIEVTIVPVMNPVGMRDGTRSDGSGLDPNRDHVTLASPANRALWELHAALEPHVVLDLHEMGPTPYEAQVGLPTHPNVDPRLTELARFWLLPYVVRALSTADVRFHDYVAENPDPAEQTGAEDPEDIFFSFAPITANNARNAFSLAGSLALLLETASSYEIDDLSRRTDRLYLTAVSFLEVIAGMSEEVLARTWQSPNDGETASPSLALRAEHVANPDRPSLQWLRWSDRGAAVPYTVDQWRPAIEVRSALPVPAAWLILPEETELVAHLLRHGIQVERLLEPVRLRVSAYETPDSVEPAADRTLPAGSWLVRSDQARERLLFTLIEPGSADGWFRSPLPALGSSDSAPDTPDAPDAPDVPDARDDADREFPVYRFDGAVPSLPVVAASADDLVEPHPAGGR